MEDTPYRWLNLRALCTTLESRAYVQRIKYFTARVTAPPNDPTKATRQEVYLRALQTLPRMTIKEGHVRRDEYELRKVFPRYGPDPNVPNPANGSGFGFGRPPRRGQT